jgi:hypothetical protein
LRCTATVRISTVHVAEELRREHHAVALAPVTAEVITEDLLGVALRIRVGGVDEVAAAREVGVEDLL